MHYKHISNSIFTLQRSLPSDLQEPRLRSEVMEQIYNEPETHPNRLNSSY